MSRSSSGRSVKDDAGGCRAESSKNGSISLDPCQVSRGGRLRKGLYQLRLWYTRLQVRCRFDFQVDGARLQWNSATALRPGRQ